MADREEEDGKPAATTEELMRTAPPSSVLGDVEDAVAPEVDGEQTPWSLPEEDEEEG
jgi:hypothetical protein